MSSAHCSERGCVWPVEVLLRRQDGPLVPFCARHWKMYRSPHEYSQRRWEERTKGNAPAKPSYRGNYRDQHPGGMVIPGVSQFANPKR